MKKFMVVDDSKITVEKIKAMLEGLGHQVVCTAHTGADAVARFAEARPDAVTMDITMPDMDGIEATQKILEIAADAKVIMVTSHGQEKMVVNALNTGAVGYVLKPVKKDSLESAITDAFEDDN